MRTGIILLLAATLATATSCAEDDALAPRTAWVQRLAATHDSRGDREKFLARLQDTVGVADQDALERDLAARRAHNDGRVAWGPAVDSDIQVDEL